MMETLYNWTLRPVAYAFGAVMAVLGFVLFVFAIARTAIVNYLLHSYDD